jgi:anti-sigma B factor antagonist
MAKYKRLEVIEAGDVTVVHLRDHKIIDELVIQEIGQELFQLVDAEHRTRLLLNFAAVEFLSSAALSKLIALERRIKARGGKLILSDIRPDLLKVFQITKLTRLFEIQPTEKEALRAF